MTKEILLQLSEKQMEAMSYLDQSNKVVQQTIFGGAVSGGKTFLLAYFLLSQALQYPESRGMMGRTVLKQLLGSTFVTFRDLCRQCGLVIDRDYFFNSKNSIVTLKNGSEIYLMDLAYQPSDPKATRYGSYEFNFVAIDEASQVDKETKDVLFSRIRYRFSDWGLVPKMLLTCNPEKNHMYTEYYKPWRDGTLPESMKFIPAKVGDNPFANPDYAKQFAHMSPESRDRLLNGNWEYADDATSLMKYEDILHIFNPAEPKGDKKYISCDVAYMGEDKTVILVWQDFVVIDYKVMRESEPPVITREVLAFQQQYQVPNSRTVIDCTGGYGRDTATRLGCQIYIANARAKHADKENFANLRVQLYYKLAQKVQEREIFWATDDPEIKEHLTQELEQVKQKTVLKAGRINLIGKDQIKQAIGRSPDYSDALSLRMFFDFKRSVHIL